MKYQLNTSKAYDWDNAEERMAWKDVRNMIQNSQGRAAEMSEILKAAGNIGRGTINPQTPQEFVDQLIADQLIIEAT